MIKNKVGNSKYFYLLPIIPLIFSFYLVLDTSNEIVPSSMLIKSEKIRIEKEKKIIESEKFLMRIKKTNDHKRIETVKTIIAVFPDEIEVEALKIASCESSFIYNNKNKNRDGTRDWGVFQLNDGGTLQRLGGNPSKAININWNVKAALELYKDRGWKPWVCAKKYNLNNKPKLKFN